MRTPSILKLGVTGGIGSGKSEVCRLFRRLGVPVLSADDLAKEISEQDPAVRTAIGRLFGPEAYDADRSLNRPLVASALFSNPRTQKKLEAIVHPRVRKGIIAWFRTLARDGERIGIVEAALIFEAGLEDDLDAVIVVDAGEATRIDRVRRRDAASEADVRRRMDAQLDQKTKLEKADYIIRNDGSRDELEQSVAFLYRLFTQLRT